MLRFSQAFNEPMFLLSLFKSHSLRFICERANLMGGLYAAYQSAMSVSALTSSGRQALLQPTVTFKVLKCTTSIH